MAKERVVRRRESAKANARRLEIQNAAAALFAQRGVDRVSMDDIANEVGLAKPSLYHYFPSKEIILFAIQSTVMKPLLEQIEARAASGDSTEEKLLGIFRDAFDSMDLHPGHVRVFFENIRLLDDEHRASIRADQRRYEALVIEIIQQGIDQGVLRQTDTHTAAFAFLGMINWAYHWYRKDGPLSHQELAEQFFEIYLGGVRVAKQ